MRTFTFSTLLLACIPSGLFADDIDTLLTRFRQTFYDAAITASESETQDLLSSLKTDGTWPDIDYTAKDAAGWNPLIHLDRVAQLAKVYVATGHALAGSAEVAGSFSKALDAWIRINPKSTNWWYNEIGSQLRMTPSIYLMRSRLSTSQKVGTDSLLARSWKSSARTGANLVWISKITLWRAALNRDEPMIKETVAAIAGTIVISTAEGIQIDNSFHQHGAQLYSGGYGVSFVSDCVSLASDLKGTPYQFAQGKLDLLADYLLQGDRWMVRGSTMDHSIRGREITRVGTGSAGSFGKAATNLSGLVPGKSVELAAFGTKIKSASGSSVDGARYFWRSEYLAQHRSGYFISVRMASSRLRASEVVNEEGLLSQYLADGTTFLYRSGYEYTSIFPVWDWCRIPGTTVAHADTPPAMKASSPGAGDFAGGVSDGKFGVASFDYDKLGVTTRKGWFYFDREMLALGAGITSQSISPINTTLNQCLLDGAVTAATGTAAAPTLKVIAPGASLPSGVQWIHHDSIGYIFPVNGTKVAMTSGKVSGSWTRINVAQSPANVNKDVFSLWIDHGQSPTDATYQYIVLMSATTEETSAYAANPDVQVLFNSAALQAAQNSKLGITEAVFYAAGTLNLSPNLSLSPDRACIMLVREEAGKLVVGISDPRRGITDLHVKTKVKLTGTNAVWSETDKSTTLSFVLPKGDSAGATRLISFGNGSGIRSPVKSTPGLSLSAIRIGTGSGSAITVAYAVPGPGHMVLALEDIRGRTLARLFQGKVEGGSHEWTNRVKGNANALAHASHVFVSMEWEGQRLIAPVDRQ